MNAPSSTVERKRSIPTSITTYGWDICTSTSENLLRRKKVSHGTLVMKLVWNYHMTPLFKIIISPLTGQMCLEVMFTIVVFAASQMLVELCFCNIFHAKISKRRKSKKSEEKLWKKHVFLSLHLEAGQGFCSQKKTCS